MWRREVSRDLENESIYMEPVHDWLRQNNQLYGTCPENVNVKRDLQTEKSMHQPFINLSDLYDFHLIKTSV